MTDEPTAAAPTADEDAKRLANVLRARAAALTGDQLATTWRQERGRYAFDLVLPSGRNARVIVSVSVP